MRYSGIKCEIWRLGMSYGDAGYAISSSSSFTSGIRSVLVRPRSKWTLDCSVLGVLGIRDGLSPASIIKPCSSPKWSAGGGRRQCKVRRDSERVTSCFFGGLKLARDRQNPQYTGIRNQVSEITEIRSGHTGRHGMAPLRNVISLKGKVTTMKNSSKKRNEEQDDGAERTAGTTTLITTELPREYSW